VWNSSRSWLGSGKDEPCSRSHRWNLPVSNGPESVHPSGHAISHSNASGLTSPKTLTHARQQGCFCIDGAQKFAVTVGVCKKPIAAPNVVSTQVFRRERKASGAVTHRLKVLGRPVDSPSLDVLGKNVPGSDICHDSPHFRPEVIRRVPARCGRRVGLTGKPARNHVNTSSPLQPIKGPNVVPNGEACEVAIVLPLHEYPGCMGVSFNSADGSPSKQFSPKNSATSAREKSQLIHDSPTRFHTYFRFKIMLHHEHFHTLFR
jgi:hypothetical protein